MPLIDTVRVTVCAGAIGALGGINSGYQMFNHDHSYLQNLYIDMPMAIIGGCVGLTAGSISGFVAAMVINQ